MSDPGQDFMEDLMKEKKEEDWIWNNHEDLKNEFVEEHDNDFRKHCKSRYMEAHR